MNEAKKIILPKAVTPTTKRIGIIALGAIAVTSMLVINEIDKALLVVIPVITAIAALIDGGK